MEQIFLNDLIEKYPNKSLLEINDILLQSGVDNKRIKIRVNCKVCGKEIITTPGSYRKQKSFTCEEHMKHKPSGKNSVFYNRVISYCSYCGKEIELIPWKTKQTNKFGDCNNFCSRECYCKFRSKYYRGEKGAMYQHEYTNAQRQNLSKGAAKRFQNTDGTNTKIQLKVNEMLDKLNIAYRREYTVDFYSCDNFLLEYNCIIEVMGDYWHGNPIRYNEDKYPLNEIQTRTILKDKQKRGYIKNHYGYPILNLWENDINKYPEKCEALLKLYIQNNGELDDYESFNYSYIGNQLVLNEGIVIPYQNKHSDEYSHLVKIIS